MSWQTKTIAVLTTAALTTSIRSVHATGAQADVAGFDGNSGAPDLHGALETGVIDGSKADLVHSMSGRWEVGPAGEFRWSLGLDVVPGINGVQPSLSIEYDSQADNGVLGQGFALLGLPAIVRVPGLVNGAAGLAPAGVQFGENDGFAVAAGGFGTPVSPRDKLVAGAFGASTYHTAIESWVQYTPHGRCGVAAFSPCTWVARDGAGNTYFYGASADGRLMERDAGQDDVGVPVAGRGVLAWGLTHYRDMHGNVYRVEYHDDGFMLYPERIEYGCQLLVDPGPYSPPPPPPPEMKDDPVVVFDPVIDPDAPLVTTIDLLGSNSPFIDVAMTPVTPGITIEIGDPDEEDPWFGSCDGGRVVRFEYESREDVTAMPARYELRLDRVTMYAEGRSVRGYAFDYEDHPSPAWGQTRLRRIVELGRDLVTEAPATRFTWSDGKAPDKRAIEDRPWLLDADERVATLAGDVDGDGMDDIVRVSFGTDRRRVSFALGQATAGEANTAPLGPSSPPMDAGGDHRRWSALLADIDLDGRDDLVLWFAHQGQAAIEIHPGTASGLGAAVPYFDNPRVAAFAAVGGRDSEDYRLLVADIDGDQVSDLVMVDQHPDDANRVAYARGGTAGLGGWQATPGAQLEVDGVPAWLEPVVTDIDGDGIEDIVVSYSRIVGVTSQIFRGHPEGLGGGQVLVWNQAIDDATCPGSCFELDECSCTGITPFQVLTTDANGDGIGDLTLAYTGPAVPMGNSQPTPFGRNVRTWLGQTDFDAIPLDGQGRRVDAGKHQILDPVGYPGLDYGAPNLAHWEHHAGDVNGDGFSDLIGFYSGVGGLRAGFAIGTPQGELGPITTITPCAAASDDANWADGCSAEPDGDADVHRWHSQVVDLDGDGREDLLRYFAGTDGRFVERAAGSTTGLGAFERILEGSAVQEVALPELDHARSVELSTPDVNGDGRRDLVLASQGGILVMPSEPGTPDDIGRPDLLTRVDNGYAGAVQIEYEMAARLTGVVDPDVADCGSATGDDCGVPQRRPRPLTTRTVDSDGLGGAYGTRYAYANGRYYPGPIVVSAAGLRPHSRADLAFATVEHVHEPSGRVTRYHYHQDPDLKRLVAQVDVEARFYPPLGAGSPGSLLARREVFDYSRSPSPFNTTKIQLDGKTTTTYEWGMLGTEVQRSWTYDGFGGVATETECADERCRETEIRYFPADLAPDRYIIQRKHEIKMHVPGKDNVISWERHDYAGGDLLRRVERLLCDDSEACQCYEDAASCVGDGSGSWVALEDDREYDVWGNLTARSDARGHVTEFEYDDTFHTYLSATQSEVGTTAGGFRTVRTESTYDDAGRVATETDANDNVTNRFYDALGRAERVEHPNARIEEWDYPDEGDPQAQRVRYDELVDADGTQRWEERYFDGLGRLHTLRVSAGGEVLARHYREYYDNEHRIEIASDPYLESAGGALLWTETIHDPRDRVELVNRVENASVGGGGSFAGALRRTTYLPSGHMLEENAAPVDDDGHVLGEDWHQKVYEYDSLGNVVAVEEQGPQWVATTYFYDEAMRLQIAWGRTSAASVGPIYAEQFVALHYDTFGRRTIIQDDNGWQLLDYDDGGNLRFSDDAIGETIEWTYDELGRVRTRTSTAGVETYTYDDGTNGVGKLVGLEGPWGREALATHGFDAAGNPLGRTLELTGLAGTWSESYAYDLRGRVVSKTLPDATVLAYDYDDAGQLREVTVDGALWAEYDQYDARGNPGLRITPAALTTYEYNGDHRLLRVASEPAPSGGGGPAFVEYSYSYDAVGNVLAIVDERSPDAMADKNDFEDTWTFTYDALDRLASATDASGNFASYEYDEAGNITRKDQLHLVHSPSAIAVYQGPPSGQPIAQLGSDGMGRTESKVDGTGKWGYVHDALGRLIRVDLESATLAEHVYDSSGRRVRKVEYTGSEAITTWSITPNFELRETDADPGRLVATHSIDGLGNGVIATRTIDALAGAPTDPYSVWPEPMETGHVGGQPPGVWFHHHNHIDSVAVVTDDRGVPIARYRNTPWGERTDGSLGFDAAGPEFTGQQRDELIGLLYYGARYYDPWLGRFLTPDADDFGRPLHPSGPFDPSSLNRLAYVRNNPVRYVDPTGHEDAASSFVRNAERDLERLDNEIVEFEGQTMTMKEAMRRIDARPTCAGLGCVGQWLDRKWKDWRGEDADVFLKVSGELNFKKIAGVSINDQGDVSVKGEQTSVDEKSISYKPDVTLEAGVVRATGSVGATKDGRLKANLSAGVGKSIAAGKAEAKAEATLAAETTGRGTVKVQPGAAVSGALKPIDGLGISIQAGVKDGSSEVVLPQVPTVQPGPILAPGLDPALRMQGQLSE